MKKAVFTILYGVLMLSVSGCKVDSQYDFNKLNTEMTVMKGATFPVPSPDPIYLKDIIQPDGYDYITTDENGNYVIQFDVPAVRMEVTIPNAIQGNRVPTDFVPTTYSFGDIPDFLSSDNQHVEPDLSQMNLWLNLESDIPAEFTVSSTIETLRGGSVQQKFGVENLAIREGFTQYRLREHTDGFGNPIEVPGLGKLLSPIPDEFRVSTLDVFADPDQFALVNPGTQHTIICSASVWAPIAFSENTRFKVTVPLAADLNLEEIGLKKAVLQGAVENSIPLDFKMNLYALDGNGKRIDTIRFSQDSEDIFIPGRSTSGLYLVLTTDGDLRFSSLVLELTASSNQYLAGQLFNVNQSITLRDLVLELPDGIVIKLDE